MDGRANPLMERKVVVILQLQRSSHLQLLDVAWCSAVEVVVVVWRSGVVVVM